MAAEAAEAPRSAGPSAGDSYVGSVISLTSKCEIRYEGVLYNINTQESSIGLKNVRSFGTEGRKKDGPQIPAGDKVYEYILFRGSDIKDLQVKSSPPVQNAPIHDDPAIIQSHYSRPLPASASFPPAGSGLTPDPSSHTAHLGLPRSPFQGNLPLYQPALGSWGPSPAPPANGSGLPMPSPMPMYWQGYYAPAGTLPHLQQPPLMRPPPGLSIPQSMQHPLQYPGGSTSLLSGSQNLQESPSPLFPTFNSTLGSTSATTIPSTLSPPQGSTLASGMPSSQAPTKVTVTSIPASTVNANPSSVPQLSSGLEAIGSLSQNIPANVTSSANLLTITNASHQTVLQPASLASSQVETLSANASIRPQLASTSEPITSLSQNMRGGVGGNPRITPVSNISYQAMPQCVPSTIGPSGSSQTERSLPLVTPDRLSQPASSVISSSQPPQTSLKNVQVKPQEAKTKVTKPLLREPPMMAPVETKEPILPLPTPTRQEPNGAVLHTHQISRGRGRGRRNGYPLPVTKFSEDFDFTAMNEKFNKDEVWGRLGKCKAQVREVDGEDDVEILDEEDDKPSKLGSKPTYVKDDFFDALSCDALDRGSQNGRPRFSEQLKIDAETFGDFSRQRPVRGGGRGFRGGGRTWGGYYGRGRSYGYGGRGRGQSGPYRPF